MDTLVEIWMVIVGISMALSGLPQISKIIKRKSSGDISLPLWYIIIHGQLWWMIYGIYINKISLIVANAACVLITGYLIFLILKYRNN